VLLEALKDRNWHVRTAAVDSLRVIGPAAKDVVPAIAGALKDIRFNVRWTAINALRDVGAAGKEAVPELILALEDEMTRYTAIEILGKMGPDAIEAVPALIQALGFKFPDERKMGVGRVCRVDAEEENLFDCASSSDQDSDWTPGDVSVRKTAAEALGNIGPAAKDAVPALTNALHDVDHRVRGQAAAALGKMGTEAEDSMPALTEALKDKDADVRAKAEEALLRIRAIPQ
jgi:HEAT repeat protein